MLICVRKLTIIGLDNGLTPGLCQDIIWTNSGILLIEPLAKKFSEILIGTHPISFQKMHLKLPDAKWHPFVFRPQCVNILELSSEAAYDIYGQFESLLPIHILPNLFMYEKIEYLWVINNFIAP